MNYTTFLIVSVLLSMAMSMPRTYHTTEQINQELESICQKCSFITLENASEEPLIKQLNINRGTGKKYKGYILFGEHPRELISPESGLHFVKELCDETLDAKTQKIIDNYELRMILNANPMSRQKVEQGEYCLRENEHGVDLNRNYDAHWEKIQDDVRQITSGPAPFSEPETQAIRNSLKSFNPDIFLSVHSGTLGMYTPHAYSMDNAEVNDDKMLDILGVLQNNYCPSCDVGAAGREVGYLSPGSCIDYAYDELNIRYSFAFEIYHNMVDLQQEVQQNLIKKAEQSFLQIQEGTAKRAKQPKRAPELQHSCFLQTSAKTNEMDDEQCFSYFNPDDLSYNWYVDNWSEAYKDMLIKMIDEEQPPKVVQFD